MPNKAPSKISKRKPITIQVFTSVLISLLVSAGLIALLSFFIYRNTSITGHAEQAAATAAAFAATIDQSRFEIAAGRTWADPYVFELRENLDSIKEILPGIDSIYIVLEEDGALTYFAADYRDGYEPSFGDAEPDRLRFGEELFDAISTMEMTTTGIHRHPVYGQVVRGFAPVLYVPDDEEPPIVTGVVVIEYSVGHIMRGVYVFIMYIAVIAFVTSILAAFVIKNRVAKNLSFTMRRIIEADHTFSGGATTFKARDTDKFSKDEIATLYYRFSEMFNTFSTLLRDIQHMAESHIQGDYEVCLDESKYSGGHLALVQAVNQMTKLYVGNFIELLNVVKTYGEGDFEANVSRYTEKWRWANNAIDTLRANFIHVTDEINKMAAEAAQGHFDIHADVGTQQGEWANLIGSLNLLIESFAGPLSAIKDNIVETSKGDFSLLEGDYKGHFGTIKEALNMANNTSRNITEDISRVLVSVSEGDLTARPEKDYVGSYAGIRDAILFIAESLNGQIKRISSSAGQVLAASDQLSQSSDQLAEGTMRQAETISQLKLSAQDIREKTIANSARASDADGLAKTSDEHAKSGNTQMNLMLKSMEEIKGASENISNIIKVIEGISFQTHLLALNASIEAARAGKHGTGFSVVADEVRNLAVRSQVAAKETTDMITESLQKTVDSGVVAASSTDSSLDKIVESVKQVSVIISQIADISANQADAITKILDEIEKISAITQNNAATGQEASAMAANFREQARALSELVAFYKVKPD